MDKPPATVRREAPRCVFLTAVILILAMAYLIRGRFDSRFSQFLLIAPAVLLFFSQIRYTRIIEGRRLLRLLPYSAAVWAFTWAIEAAGVRSGLYRYQDVVLNAFRLGPVPLLIPTVWMLFCWLAESITEYLFGIDRGLRWSGLRRSLASAWILVSIAFTLEWHFSRFIGLWSWAEASAGLRIDGIPLINFLIWFAVGLAAPLLADLTRAPVIRYRTDNGFLRALPAIGFGLTLAINAVLNFARGFTAAGALVLISLFVLGGASVFPRSGPWPAASRPQRDI
jgi:hypothetical protein